MTSHWVCFLASVQPKKATERAGLRTKHAGACTSEVSALTSNERPCFGWSGYIRDWRVRWYQVTVSAAPCMHVWGRSVWFALRTKKNRWFTAAHCACMRCTRIMRTSHGIWQKFHEINCAFKTFHTKGTRWNALGDSISGKAAAFKGCMTFWLETAFLYWSHWTLP